MRFFVLLAVIASGSLLSAQTSFSLESVMSAPFASNPVASPTGKRVVWMLNEAGARNVWTAEAPDWKGRRLTSFDKDDGQDLGELAWTVNGETVLFTHGGDFENGGDNPNPDLNPTRPDQSIWSVAFDGKPPRKVTEGHAPSPSPAGNAVAFIKGGQIYLSDASGEHPTLAIQTKGNPEGLAWSPDGKQFAFVLSRRDHSFVGLYKPETKTLEFVDPSSAADSSVTWSSDSTRLAYIRSAPRERSFDVRRAGEPWSLRIYDLRTGTAKELFCAEAGPGSLFHSHASEQQLFWDAGGHIIFPWEKTGWLHLYRVSQDGGTAEELTPGDGEVEHAAQSQDHRNLFYSANIGDSNRRHIWRLASDGNTKPTQVTKGDSIEWLPTPLAGSNDFFALASSFNMKAHAVLIHENGRTQDLAPQTIPSSFPASALVKPEDVTITAADGMQIHGQLFRPSTRGSEPHPALAFFHGGSRRQMLLGFHYMYYYSNAYAMNQFLASQGYVVLSVNYRSGIGYGLNFREALNYGPSGGSEYADVVGAGLYLKSRTDVDGKRIGIWGGSYGGYLTAMALARGSDLFAAGVDFHGVHDWSTIRNFEFTGGDPEGLEQARKAARIAFESSPMASVSHWRSPVLLIHGDDDRNVPFSQTVTLAAALRRQHVPFEELIFPNEIHDFLEHKHWVAAYKATAAFFQKYLHPQT